MVCAEKDGRPVVIGMGKLPFSCTQKAKHTSDNRTSPVQGGYPTSDCNLILLFNTEMGDWLNAATDSAENEDPVHIGKRVVMA